MAFLARRTSLVGLSNRPRPIPPLTSQSNSMYTPAHYLLLFLNPSRTRNRWLSTGTESTQSELAGKNAYELLGVSETSSFAEIKASFRKLAKETHPDLAQSHSHSSASDRFVRILAAYEVLSDSEKRLHYDRYLLSQRMRVQRCSEQFSMMYTYETDRIPGKEMEVVEWLKWYRCALNDILSEKRVVVGSGYFDILERDFYSAVHAAYYGPDIESVNLLPYCFEAEERSTYETPEVLHLVSGRDLFGIIRLAGMVLELSQSYNERLTSFEATENPWIQFYSGVADVGISGMKAKKHDYHASDAYKDLELHISGKMVAVATRVLPKSCSDCIGNEDSQDHIHVYLISQEDPIYTSKGSSMATTAVGPRLALGTITGLGTNPEEGSCFVYDMNGTKTHVIMKHRTLLVKHMHWYQVGDRVSVAECRCCRARLPPSKFWLFEPRCGMHDIGGWYVETFGRDKKGRTVPSRRYWDGFDVDEQFDKRLHPAIYLLALAYRTLDLEDAKSRKESMKDIIEGKLSGIITWCKKLV